MLKNNTLQLVRESVRDIRQPVRMAVFTAETGCDACSGVLELAQHIASLAPKVAYERYDITMDRDKSEEYGVKRVPSIVVQAPGGKVVTFSGEIEGVTLILLLKALAAPSREEPWFPEGIAGTLALLRKEVRVRVLLENDCSLCMPVAETAAGLALTNRLLTADIIVADDYPEILSKYRVKVLPYTLFGESLHLEGHVTESEFLEKIFLAEGQKASGLDRRCMVCSAPTGDIICGSCKTKIQAEAVNHKRKDEHFQEKGSSIESQHHGH